MDVYSLPLPTASTCGVGGVKWSQQLFEGWHVSYQSKGNEA